MRAARAALFVFHPASEQAGLTLSVELDPRHDVSPIFAEPRAVLRCLGQPRCGGPRGVGKGLETSQHSLVSAFRDWLVNSSGDSAGDELKYAGDQPRMTGTGIPGIG